MDNAEDLLVLVANALNFAVPPLKTSREIAFMLVRHIEQELMPNATLGADVQAKAKDCLHEGTIGKTELARFGCAVLLDINPQRSALKRMNMQLQGDAGNDKRRY